MRKELSGKRRDRVVRLEMATQQRQQQQQEASPASKLPGVGGGWCMWGERPTRGCHAWAAAAAAAAAGAAAAASAWGRHAAAAGILLRQLRLLPLHCGHCASSGWWCMVVVVVHAPAVLLLHLLLRLHADARMHPCPSCCTHANPVLLLPHRHVLLLLLLRLVPLILAFLPQACWGWRLWSGS